MRILFNEYGILIILILLVVFFSLLTIEKQSLEGSDAGIKLAASVNEMYTDGTVMLVTSGSLTDNDLAESFVSAMESDNIVVIHEGPPEARKTHRGGHCLQSTAENNCSDRQGGPMETLHPI